MLQHMPNDTIKKRKEKDLYNTLQGQSQLIKIFSFTCEIRPTLGNFPIFLPQRKKKVGSGENLVRTYTKPSKNCACLSKCTLLSVKHSHPKTLFQDTSS